MSRIIKLGDSQRAEMLAEFVKCMDNAKLTDGKFTYSKSFGTVDKKATVYFSQIAYLKMISLVKGTDKEIAWHGIVKRHETEKYSYIVEDIVVYPQEVTGATVNTDQAKYELWLMQQEDEVFNNIRMQGHSHVNMATSPSAVDIEYYDKILATLPDNTFYIFLITNKRDEFWFKIYDMENNIMFEKADVKPVIMGISDFIKEAKEMVQEKVYVSEPVYNSYYQNDYYQPYQSKEKPKTNSFKFGSKKGTKKRK